MLITGKSMARKIQQKVAAALNKRRNPPEPSQQNQDWKTTLNTSNFGKLVPTLESLHIDIVHYQQASPEKLQELFTKIVDILKNDYFNQTQNRLSLKKHLITLNQQIRATISDAQRNALFISYFKKHETSIALLFINSQLDFAIKFSRLLICVVGRLIKDALKFPQNEYDNHNILNLVEELTQLHPHFNAACQEWFEAELGSYVPSLQDEVLIGDEDESDYADILSESLIEIANENQTVDQYDFIERVRDELHAEEALFSPYLLQYFAEKEPLLNLSLTTVNKLQLRKAYLKMNDLLAPSLKLTKKIEKKRLQQFIIAAINHKINEPEPSQVYDQNAINRICKRKARELSSILSLCKEIKLQRANHKSFMAELSKLPLSEEVQVLENFIKKKLQAPLYLKIKRKMNHIIKYKVYGSYKGFTNNCLQYMKILLTQPIYENSIITYLKLEHPAVIEPVSVDELTHIRQCVNKINKYSSKKEIRRECSYLLHTLIFDQELAQQLQKITALYSADLSIFHQHLLEPLTNHLLLELVQEVNNTTSISEPLNVIFKNKQFGSIKTQLSQYQQQLRELGKLRLRAILNPDDNTINNKIEETYKLISSLYAKLNVIFDLISIIEILPVNQISEELSNQVNGIKKHLHEINEVFVYLSNIAHEVGYKKVEPKDIFLLRIGRGDFFNQKDHDIIKNAVLAMLFSVENIKLIDAINSHFEQYTNEQKSECLYFVENYIQSDSLGSLFSAVNPEKNEFYLKLMVFEKLAESSKLSTKRLMQLIQNSISIKKERFNTLVKSLKSNEYSTEQLVRRINTISRKLESNRFHITKLDEYLLEISHVMNAPAFDNFTTLQKTQLLSSFNQLNQFCSAFPFYQQEFDKLKKQLNALLLKTPSSKQIKQPAKVAIKFQPKSSLLELIRNTIENKNNQSLYDKMITKFINNIENEFACLFAKIDISELRDLNWTLDSKRLNEGLTPYSPNVLNYHRNLEMATHYISFAIFYQLDSNFQPSAHQNLALVKSFYEFFETALVKAFELKAPTTAFILFRAIQSSPIKRLGLASPKAEAFYFSYLSKTKEAQVKITKLFRQAGVLPQLSFIQQMLIFSYKKNSGSHFEHLGNVGRSLRFFLLKKEAIIENDLAQSNFTDEIKYFLNALHLISSHEAKIDTLKSQTLLMKASTDLKPDHSKKYNLSDFKTINELAKYLTVCRARFIDYHFNLQNPEKEIVDWLLSTIKSDNRFTSFTDCIEVLFLVDEINRYQKRVYKQFHSDLITILTYYYRRIGQILKSDNETNKKNLELLFVQLNKLKRLREFQDEDNSFDLFSSEQKVQDLIKKMREQYRLYLNMQEQFDKHRSQTAYTQLLADVLSGNTQKSLALPVEQDEKTQTMHETLLPDNEYDIPSAEPEHPSRIGINKTMTFTTQEQSSILALFNTEELKAEFLAAFPWAIQVDTLDKLRNLQFDPEVNLLGTPKLFGQALQLAVMRLVLIAMDSLGKIAGFTGQLTIANFDRINEIINQLKWLTGELKAFDISEPKLLAEVEAVIQEMGFKNQEYYDIQQLYNPPFEVENNPNMNGFCHLNEHLAYELTGTHYTDTLLAPNVPASPYFEQISQIVINHEKT